MSESHVTGDLFCDKSGTYNSCDLYLAAFLLSSGCRMSSSERDPKTKRVYFVFEKNPMINELKVSYFARQAKVDALSFADNIKSLKSLCHNLSSESTRY